MINISFANADDPEHLIFMGNDSALNISFKQDEDFELDLQKEVLYGVKQSQIEEYTDKYEVVPTIEGETLNTANKKLNKDIKIEPIPSYEVSNNSGGTTFSIG